jgi:hypothetical protein
MEGTVLNTWPVYIWLLYIPVQLPQPFSHFSFITVKAGPRAGMDTLNKENPMPLLEFGPPFPVLPLHTQDFLKNVHFFVLTTLREMEHTYSTCCFKTQTCVAKNKTGGTYKCFFFRCSQNQSLMKQFCRPMCWEKQFNQCKSALQSNPVITTLVYVTPHLQHKAFCGTNSFLAVKHDIILLG